MRNIRNMQHIFSNKMEFLKSFASCMVIAISIFYFTKYNTSLVALHINSTYDYVIIGGGTAGSVLAARLSEDENTTVLLLEAGEEESWKYSLLHRVPFLHGLLQNSLVDWEYYTEPQTHSSYASPVGSNRSYWPRGKVLGGSAMLNSMQYVRGNKADYDKWAESGCKGWGYKDVLPYFLKSEDILIDSLSNSKYHHKGGFIGVSKGTSSSLSKLIVDAGKEIGYKEVDYNGEQQLGFSIPQVSVRNGVRSGTVHDILYPIMNRYNLHVAVSIRAAKVLFNNKRAVGVEYVRNGQNGVVYAKKEIIVSAGAINTPQLLLISGIGPKQHLNSHNIPVVKDLPVGRNLQDHMLIFLPTTLNSSDCTSFNPISVGIDVLKYIFTGKGMFASPAVETTAFLNTDDNSSNPNYPDIQLHALGFLPARKDIMMDQELIKDIFPEDYTCGVIFVPILLHPKSRGVITLKGTDPFIHPAIDPKYLTEKQDIATFIRGIRAVERLIDSQTFKSIGANYNLTKMAACSQHKNRSDDFWECYIRYNALTVYHPTSTCRMGHIDDPDTVVDEELKVKGVLGLRIVDASIMPDIISGNINAPTVMIAEKAADMIRNRDTVAHIRRYLQTFDHLQ